MTKPLQPIVPSFFQEGDRISAYRSIEARLEVTSFERDNGRERLGC